MLTPIHPQKSELDYQKKAGQFRQDTADKTEHPHNWGVVRGETTPKTVTAPDIARSAGKSRRRVQK